MSIFVGLHKGLWGVLSEYHSSGPKKRVKYKEEKFMSMESQMNAILRLLAADQESTRAAARQEIQSLLALAPRSMIQRRGRGGTADTPL